MKLCLVRKLLGSCLLGFVLGLPALARLLCAQVYVQQCFCYCILCGYYEHLRALGQNLKFYCWQKTETSWRISIPCSSSLLFLPFFLPPLFYDCCQCWQLVSGGGDYTRVGGAVWGNNYAVNLTEIFQLKGNEINSNQIRQSIYHSRAGESLTHTRPHPQPHTRTSTHRHPHSRRETETAFSCTHKAASGCQCESVYESGSECQANEMKSPKRKSDMDMDMEPSQMDPTQSQCDATGVESAHRRAAECGTESVPDSAQWKTTKATKGCATRLVDCW